MKKNILLFIFLSFVIYLSHGDIIPTGHHSVYRSVIIANCNAYPDYTLVGFITGPMIAGYKILVIEEGVPLNKGYKFNTIKLYAIHRDVISAMGGVEKINYAYVNSILTPAAIIDPTIYTVEDANPLSGETVIYTIWGIAESELVLYISRRSLEYNDGSPDTIEDYTYIPEAAPDSGITGNPNE